MHGGIKVFAPHKVIPGLPADANREVVHQFRQVADELAGHLEAITVRVTELKTASGYVVQLGEIARVNPPAAGLTITLPPVTEANEGDECAVAVVSVASGGSVTVSAVNGAKINGASTMTLTAVGLYVFSSLGSTYEGWVTQPVGGGGGLTPPVALTDLQQVTGPTLLGRVSGLGSILELTPAQYTSILNVFTAVLQGAVPASGGGTANFLRADGTWAAPTASVAFTDATITLPFANKQSDVVAIVDGTITGTEKLMLTWGTTSQTDENHPEMESLSFVATVAAGLIAVRVTTTNPSERVGGSYKIRYLKG